MKNTLNLQAIKESANQLARVSEGKRNLFLSLLGETLKQKQADILNANEKDLARARAAKLSSAFVDRLVLDQAGLKQVISKLGDIGKLHSNVGEILEEKINDQGLTLLKKRVPLGVIAVIYESRPEVTIDVAALCVKSGNAVILKGGSEALWTNKVLYECILVALEKSDLAAETVSFVTSSDRRVTHALLKQHKFIDLVIARGGYGLVQAVVAKSTIPVLAHAAGGARMYVDKSADLALAEKVIINSKVSKPAACNSLDTIVVHRDIADVFVGRITAELEKYKVRVVEGEWDTEFLGLKVAVKVVENLEKAIDFVNKHSKRHSEGIIARDKKVIDCFVNSIDAAALFINCSTRLHDGYVFGLGSEMGISTGKLHARGPVGLKELTTYKWEVYGNGQIRN